MNNDIVSFHEQTTLSFEKKKKKKQKMEQARGKAIAKEKIGNFTPVYTNTHTHTSIFI